MRVPTGSSAAPTSGRARRSPGGPATRTGAPTTGRPDTANASPSHPVKVGIWVNPNPGLLVDALEPALAGIGRTERACTIHVFRIGGNGSLSPGEAYPGMDGVSRLPNR